MVDKYTDSATSLAEAYAARIAGRDIPVWEIHPPMQGDRVRSWRGNISGHLSLCIDCIGGVQWYAFITNRAPYRLGWAENGGLSYRLDKTAAEILAHRKEVEEQKIHGKPTPAQRKRLEAMWRDRAADRIKEQIDRSETE